MLVDLKIRILDAVLGQRALDVDGPDLDRARLSPDVRVVAGGGVEPVNLLVGGDVLPQLDVLDDGRHPLHGLLSVQVTGRQPDWAGLQKRNWDENNSNFFVNGIKITIKCPRCQNRPKPCATRGDGCAG